VGPARGLHRSGTETGFGGDLMLMKTVWRGKDTAQTRNRWRVILWIQNIVVSCLSVVMRQSSFHCWRKKDSTNIILD
jgi:hypothetical protein